MKHRKNPKKRPQNIIPGKQREKGPEKTLKSPNLFGFHAVREAWLNPKRRVEMLYLTDQAAPGFEKMLQEGAALERPFPSLIDKKTMDRILPPGAVHQGIALVTDPLPEMDIEDLIIRSGDERAVFLILDQVTDPHNVGAILRSACAFGVGGVIMQRKHAPELTGVLAKTACGAIEHVPVAFETNLSRSIEALQEAGFFVVGLDERGEADIGDYKPSQKTALVLGAEGPGMRQLVKEHCDTLVRLPMHGPMPSINVSNAAAVALYALSSI